MLPTPLHPMVVHFPIALVVLLPIFAIVSLVAIRRGASPRRAWAATLAVAAALALSAFVAVRTGEADEERVEDVVPHGAIHTHEEAAERFLVLSGVLLLVAGAGMLNGTPGRAARYVATAGSVVLIAAGVQVGGAGGTLVYEHGAADAWTGEHQGAAALQRQVAQPEADVNADVDSR
jgi:uncharacterized membrane protein